MKRLSIPLVLLFIFFYLAVSASAVFSKEPTITGSQENMQEATNSPALSQDKSETKTEYNLPYPGILPDNPLYFLKALRDKIVSVLVSDPLKKAQFNLLTSDKRINASLMLVNKGKGKLAIDTLSKSNNYFHTAVSSADTAKRAGQNIDIVLHNLENSIIKHQEVLSMIQKKAGREFSGQLQSEKARMLEFEKSVNRLRF